MQQITLRGLDPEVEKAIRKISRKNNKSINQVIKEIVHKEFKKAKEKKPASSLKKLAGGWNTTEAEDFQKTIKSCEQIDEAMWK